MSSVQQRRPRKPSIVGERVVETVKTVEHKIEHALTCMWDELPSWRQDNHYIISGYRRTANSFLHCFNSLFYLHNESVNIYTHLIGALFAILLLSILSLSSSSSSSFHLNHLFIPLPHLLTQASTSDLTALTTFLLSSTTCLALSATYHTIQPHSPEVSRFGNQLDYLGIIILIWGSFVPSVHYGFRCHPHLRNTYWTMITALSLLTAAVTINPGFRTPRWRPFRAGMFVALGSSAVVPVLHGVVALYGVREMDERMGLRWVVLQGVLYVVGAGIYAARVPERWAPGKFDVWGASHQVFHVFVLLAAAAQGVGLIKAMGYGIRMGEGVCGV